MRWGILLAAFLLASTVAAGPPVAADPLGLPECADGANNDLGDDGHHDGADFPLDPDCQGPLDDRERGPACRDHIDNDGDGQTDYSADPGCDDADDDGEGAPACSDGFDNDGDGRTDHPADAGCAGSSDPDESSCQAADPAGCGGPVACADPLPPMGLRASWAPDGVLLEWQAPLGGSVPVAYLVYRLELDPDAPQPAEAIPQRLAATSGHETGYFDASAREDNVYAYWVAAAGAGCQSASSAPAGAGRGIIDPADCFYIQSFEEIPPPHTDPSLNCLPVGRPA